MKKLALAVLLLASAGACKNGTTIVTSCTNDSECPKDNRCALTGIYQGRCVCADDNACPQDAGPTFCNSIGLCQTHIGCRSNLDCPADQFCDSTTSLCTIAPGCGSDRDCPVGTICDPHTKVCTQGCHSNGDCPLDNPCVCSNGAECLCPPLDAGNVDPANYDRSTCEVGACRADTCANDTSMCPYNQTCTPAPGDGGLSTCKTDPRTFICGACTEAVAGSSCGPPSDPAANFCLIDLGTNTLFCGADCSQGESCPSGYLCDDVIILTNGTCSSSSDCPRSGPLCDANDAGTCPSGSVCLPSSDGYRCTGECVVNEGEHNGFCTCVTDQDCPKDTCETSTRRCSTSLQPCIPGPTDTCSFHIACVDTGGARGCFIGRNCGPEHGLHCPLPKDK